MSRSVSSFFRRLGFVSLMTVALAAVSVTTVANAATTDKKPAASKKAKSKGKTVANRKASANVAAASSDEVASSKVRKVVTVKGKRRVIMVERGARPVRAAFVPASPTLGEAMGLRATPDALALRSSVALVMDQNNGEVLFQKNSSAVLPIASITKLMTALVVTDAHQPMDELLEITDEDRDYERNTGSRLRFGTMLTREDLLLLALMSSENRAASALGRNYPGGRPAFVAAMNRKARELGMNDTHYVDSNGLSSSNVSSAQDLAKIVMAAYKVPLIRQFTTTPEHTVSANGRTLHYVNTNRLVRGGEWDIGLQKTGFINEAGRCLVMQANVHGRNVVMVFLDSAGNLTRFADATRVRNWLERNPHIEPATQAAAPLRNVPVSTQPATVLASDQHGA
ncbi:D-alanyl-D-alanine endopeptidase [Ralstonia pickettii]|jgi:D-alanyl-D-alanine endopeptidase (penicillin-binding protein 7)|uniref:D-alanyl-D-alanine endopeptidase n=1 Tax=Ralstonia TaxID=48736 RepID=UPI0001E693BF|nr:MULTISPECIES: D-alanyl-D-alanine endopeptidase [Ralstonia]EFP64357.1 serine-type D-Ala-D-Ala carboxypeptidase [Ralstonia pickettii]MBU6523724.1 D-alanyl-D-alanine endopeptidase [Ralstonia sp. B265]NPT49328.1 D-alanyl-D-alanine endopeptidase [Ralstonia sp. 3N]UCA14350.1 D-alanyl-D-alanine endopeptidase [Ralstonia pickettii]